MLEKRFVNKLNLADCRGFKASIGAELKLTHIRLEKLKKTQAKNPKWAAYDQYADDIVGIDIRIEEQYAVSEDLESDLGLLFEREDIINLAVSVTGKPTVKGRTPIQLSFFDSARKRARVGVPC